MDFNKWTSKNMEEVCGELGLIEILDLLVKSSYKTKKLRRLLLIYGILSRQLSIFQVCVFILIEHQMINLKWTKKIIWNWSWELLSLINWWVKELTLMKMVTFIMSRRRISKHLSTDWLVISASRLTKLSILSWVVMTTIPLRSQVFTQSLFPLRD